MTVTLAIVAYWTLAALGITVAGLHSGSVAASWDRWLFSAPWWLNVVPTALVAALAGALG